MKIFKRNAVIVAVLLLVCAAVYLNWSYNNKDAEVMGEGEIEATDIIAEENAAETSLNDSGLVYGGNAAEVSKLSDDMKEYFDTVRLNRKQARDEASETLNTVATSEGASQESIDTALEQMTAIAAWTLKESELENLIMSKGFDQCVAYMSDEGISLTVSAPEGLSTADVAKLTDMVLTETDYTADQLKIVEIK